MAFFAFCIKPSRLMAALLAKSVALAAIITAVSKLNSQLRNNNIFFELKHQFELIQLMHTARVSPPFKYFHSSYFLRVGKSYSGINDELIMVSIGMAIAIAILITLALCYIAREKCKKHREYYVTA